MITAARVVKLFSLLATVQSSRILCVGPIPSISHQIVFRAFTESLAEKGHELVVVNTLPYFSKDRFEKVKEISIQKESYRIWDRTMAYMATHKTSLVKDLHDILKAVTEVMDAQLSTTTLKELITNESETFDLLVIQCLARPAFFFSHKFKAPVIGFSSMMGLQHNYDSTGTPTNPVVYHDLIQRKIFNLTIFDMFDSIYTDLWQRYSYWWNAEEETRIGRKHFGEEMPDVRELARNMDLMTLNVNPVWDGVRPVPPNVVNVGGLHIKSAKELPKDFKSYLDGCSRGVVYMSLGSNIKSTDLPADRVQMLLSAFRDLEYCVLWKWEADELAGRPDNVRIAKWLPQADLLRHPNIRAFITQCGLQSIDETIVAEVPVVGIPFIGDQAKNAQKAVYHGIGVALDAKTLTTEVLKNAILRVIQDGSYHRNIKRLKLRMYDQPMESLERAAWWTEYLLRHGSAAHLRSPSAGASLADTCALDVLAALAAAALLAACLVAATLRYLVTRISAGGPRSYYTKP